MKIIRSNSTFDKTAHLVIILGFINTYRYSRRHLVPVADTYIY